MLADSDSDSSLDVLKVNKDFAKAFKAKKEREELSKLKDKYGSDGERRVSSDESNSETEDEDGDELTPHVDAAILRTLARIRRKDPAIYSNDARVFDEEQTQTSEHTLRAERSRHPRKDKTKPLTIKQQNMNAVLGLDPDNSDDDEPAPPTHVQEQVALRAETIAAFHSSVVPAPAADAEEDSDDDLLVPRHKTQDELDLEEEEYREFLTRAVGEDISGLVEVEREDGWLARGAAVEEEPVKKKKGKKERKKEKETAGKASGKRDDDADQKFLLDYILNRGWIDKSERRVPTYHDVTGPNRASFSKVASGSKYKPVEDSDPSEESGDEAEDEEEVEEDVFEDATDAFEQRYMYHFQEPGAKTIAAHPRPSASTANALADETVRRADTRRKEARERRKARKEEDLLKRTEEVHRLKALKVKELRRKLERIGREGKVEADALAALDLDAEWDPAAHDAQMAGIYGGEGDPEVDGEEVDADKPTWDDDIPIDDIVPPSSSSKKLSKAEKKKLKRLAKQQQGGDAEWDADAGVEEGSMDADLAGTDGVAEDGWQDEEWDGTEATRKKIIERYMAKLDGMEFNDLVGDLPTRFHYAPVMPDNFGLAAEEILLATDAELNDYAGLRRLAAYRKGKKKSWDSQRPEKLRVFRDAIKGRSWDPSMAPSAGRTADKGWAKSDTVVAEEKDKPKRKGKKERLREKAVAGDAEGGEGDDSEGKKKRKRKSGEADGNEEAGEEKPRKKKQKKEKEVVGV